MSEATREPKQPVARAVNRRRAITGVAAVGAVGAFAAACGGEESSTSAPATPKAPTTDASGNPVVIARTSEIPEGGGTIFDDQGIVITQPEPGEFKAFSNICTHQSCPVTGISDTIDCTCHGSKFSLTDGSPQEGPAPEPLPEIEITVDGTDITRA